MAHFRGTVQGSRGESSRLGTKNSGLDVEANGWTDGVRVVARHKDGKDWFDIYRTDGSSPRGRSEYIGSVRDGEFRPCDSLIERLSNQGSMALEVS